jgi:hypothetical protein
MSQPLITWWLQVVEVAVQDTAAAVALGGF